MEHGGVERDHKLLVLLKIKNIISVSKIPILNINLWSEYS